MVRNLCRRALDGGPRYTDDVPNAFPENIAAREAGIRTYVTAAVRNEAGEAELEYLFLTDPLTLLANRRQLEQQTERLAAHARRQGSKLSLLVVDLDHFKQINDEHGHEAGDAVLVAVAEALRAACRVEDVVGRWGGDEFVVLAPDTDESGAERLAQRILAAVGSLPNAPLLSIGGATAERDDSGDLFTAADAALYAAKADGRNRARVVRLAAAAGDDPGIGPTHIARGPSSSNAR